MPQVFRVATSEEYFVEKKSVCSICRADNVVNTIGNRKNGKWDTRWNENKANKMRMYDVNQVE